MVKHAAGVAIKCDRGVLMPHNIGNGFNIHSAFNSASGEGMEQGMKIELTHSRAFGELFKYDWYERIDIRSPFLFSTTYGVWAVS